MYLDIFQDYLFAGEVPRILVNIYEMGRGNLYGFDEEHQRQEIQQFYYHLDSLLKDPNNADCADQIFIIYYKGLTIETIAILNMDHMFL